MSTTKLLEINEMHNFLSIILINYLGDFQFRQQVSVRDFFEKNGVPYHVFEKWYKRKYQHPEIVDCKVTGYVNVGNVLIDNNATHYLRHDCRRLKGL